MKLTTTPEPWLRGTHSENPAVLRAALHALELAEEDVEVWCQPLNDEELNARPWDLAPLAFHIRHIARSTDRLLTYAEGGELNPAQIQALKSELQPEATKDELFHELRSALAQAKSRIAAFDTAALEEPRSVGKLRMPTTVAGLIVHVADHTQRHVGQVVTTAKLLHAARQPSQT